MISIEFKTTMQELSMFHIRKVRRQNSVTGGGRLKKYLGGTKKLTPISGRVDRASATETVDSGSIPGRVKPRTVKFVFTASLLDVQQLKGQCEASTAYGRQVGRWQLDLKTKRSLRCLLAKATW